MANKVIRVMETVHISAAIGDVQMTRLSKACCRGILDVVKEELKAASSSNDPDRLAQELSAQDDWAGSTPLHWAAFSGNMTIVQLLLDANADPTVRNTRDSSMPIHLAARYNRSQALASLAEAAPHTLLEMSGRHNTPLHESSIEGRIEAVKKILELGKKFEHAATPAGMPRVSLKSMFEVHTQGGYTPLLAAVSYGRRGVISLLLEAKADPSETAGGQAIRKATLERLSFAGGSTEPVTPIADRTRLYKSLFSTSCSSLLSASGSFSKGGGGDQLGRTGACGGSFGAQRSMSGSFGGSDTNSPLRRQHTEEMEEANRWRVPGHGALSLALATGHLGVVEQLLEAEGFPLCLRFQLLREIVLDMWANAGERQRSKGSITTQEQRQTARLFTILVLCTERPAMGADDLEADDLEEDADEEELEAMEPDEARGKHGGRPHKRREEGNEEEEHAYSDGDGAESDSGDGAESDGETSASRREKRRRRPQNPCLVALKLATECRAASERAARDRLKRMRMRNASAMLEFVASGLLYAADRAATESLEGMSDTSKGVNPWMMGKQKILPRVARDLFVHESIEHAAQYDAMIFISQPLVYRHLQETFWPSAPTRTGHRSAAMKVASAAWIVLFNLLALPLLPFVPPSWEIRLDQYFREGQGETDYPLILFWLLPSGRFTLWFVMTLCLAQLATNMPPEPSSAGGLWDLGLLLYLVGWLKTEAREAVSDIRKDGIRRYLTDPFNILDMALVVLLVLLLIGRTGDLSAAAGADQEALGALGVGALAQPCQALLALVAWLRLMQALFIFANSGPLLVMTIRMLEDLAQFLVLASFVIMAFACAFYVLFRHAHAAKVAAARYAAATGADAWDGAEGSAAVLDEEMALSVAQVLGLLIESSMKGEPDHIILHGTDGPGASFVWGVMFLFGIVVVLLLLNLLIARFAKTFDIIHENVDANFKVAFARVVIESRAKELLPPPLNILGMAIGKLLAAAAHFAETFQRNGQILSTMIRPTTPPRDGGGKDGGGGAGGRRGRGSALQNSTGGGGSSPAPKVVIDLAGLRSGHSSPLAHKPLDELEVPGDGGYRGTARNRERGGWRSGRDVDGGGAHDEGGNDRNEMQDGGSESILRKQHEGIGQSLSVGASAAATASDGRWVEGRVREYIEKALSLPDGDGLVDQVVEFVCRHQHDLGKEEQWRTEMARQVYHVEETTRGHLEALAKQLEQTNAAVERIALAVGARAAGGEGNAASGAGGDADAKKPPKDEQQQLLLAKLERALPGLIEMASQSESLAATQHRKFEEMDTRMRTHAAAVEEKLQVISSSVRSIADAPERQGAPAEEQAAGELATYVL